jgi:transcriptional regulator with XRE-family HTH domain
MAKTAKTETFGVRLRQARLEAGYTQSHLVHLSGIPKPTLSRYENDHVLPSLQSLARLALALNVPEAALLPGRTSHEEELFDALRERGVEIRSRAEALRVADTVARMVLPEEQTAEPKARRLRA